MTAPDNWNGVSAAGPGRWDRTGPTRKTELTRDVQQPNFRFRAPIRWNTYGFLVLEVGRRARIFRQIQQRAG